MQGRYPEPNAKSFATVVSITVLEAGGTSDRPGAEVAWLMEGGSGGSEMGLAAVILSLCGAEGEFAVLQVYLG